jgi:hypothetical protein
VRLGKKSRKGCVPVFRLGSNKYLKKYADNKGTAANAPQTPPATAPLRVNASVQSLAAIFYL